MWTPPPKVDLEHPLSQSLLPWVHIPSLKSQGLMPTPKSPPTKQRGNSAPQTQNRSAVPTLSPNPSSSSPKVAIQVEEDDLLAAREAWARPEPSVECAPSVSGGGRGGGGGAEGRGGRGGRTGGRGGRTARTRGQGRGSDESGPRPSTSVPPAPQLEEEAVAERTPAQQLRELVAEPAPAAKKRGGVKQTRRNTRCKAAAGADVDDAVRTGGAKRKATAAVRVKPKPVCNFFLRGVCKAGDACEYQHTGVPRTKSQLCKFWRSSPAECQKGDACPYAHDFGVEACKNLILQGSCAHGDKCKFSHRPLEADEVEKYREEFTEMHERQAKAQRMAAAVREAERRTESDEAQAQPAGLTDAPPPMLAAIFTPQTALHTPLTAGLGNGTNPYATFDAFTPSASSPGVAEAEAGAEASAGEEQPQRSSPEDSPYGDERAVRCTASEADASSTFPYATPAAPAAAATAAAAASGSTRRSARRG